ncbi:DNA translocase FtsK [Bacillus sp. DX1.1]|uniref:DNA translocase FtsK n=1 Tax=unclassified Bacillus (in: firmicutes) TaxID=185979 RepID=UPI002570B412|nr:MULTISPECIES: DNA translocase FtsK [unclassified Bacillus (in: firmicutes)]MDM5156851.1 DNA translocase FtsK [Bacillus sp. DX1.1]WJE81097.1 DNA translocase FtsK [Bacillus sp. DX3.1]
MLDWMKKLFNKEEQQEEKTVVNKETSIQTEGKPRIPRVNHYTEVREAQMSSRNAGVKCRFPLIPDEGFAEENVEETLHFQQQFVQRPTSNRERRRHRHVEVEQTDTVIEPVVEHVVKKTSIPVQESSRRPFRPTEMISPIFGYNRPSVENQEVQEEENGLEDLEICVEGKAVVDAWLEKKGYSLSDVSAAPNQSSEKQQQEDMPEHDAAEQQKSSTEEQSVVDKWLEKNGYVSDLTASEEQEDVDAFAHSSAISVEKQIGEHESTEVGKKEHTVGTIHSAEHESDVVALSQHGDEVEEESLQDEVIDPTVESMNTALTEENECKKEIKEESEEEVLVEAVEESEEEVLVEAVEESEEEVLVEAVEESEEEVLVEAVEESEEEVLVEAVEESEEEVLVEAVEESEEEVLVEAVEESEEEVLVEAVEEPEEEVLVEAVEESEEEVLVEAVEESEEEVLVETVEEPEEEVLVETVEESEEEVLVEAVEESEEEVLVETVEEPEEEVLVETVEEPEEEVLVEAVEESEEEVLVETVEEPEEEVLVEAVEESEEEVLVEAVEESEEEVLVEAVEESEEEASVETAEEPEEEMPVQVSEESIEQESLEGTIIIEQTVISAQETIVSETERSVLQPSAVADEQTKEAVQNFADVLIEEAEEKQEVVLEQPVKQIEEPKREKKRHVPFNVVMLKQDKRKLIEKNVAGMKVSQAPTQQIVKQESNTFAEQTYVKEQPVQQVEAETFAKEQPVQQVEAETFAKEQLAQQVVVETFAKEQPVQQVVVEALVKEQPVQQVVVETFAKEQPVQQAVAETQATQGQEKEYVVKQQEHHDIRNVLQTPPKYEFPSLTLLTIPSQSTTNNTEWLEEQKELLNTTFNNFHVGANVVNVTQGPAVTRFEVQPEPGVKVNKITNLSDDIKLNLAARDIRIEAPIPGKSAVGIEVPNKESKPVFLREILRSPVFTKSESPLTVALGLDISGAPIVTDLRKMPHGLIAGATGSGKSVCINAILTSILYKAKPHEVKLMLIDPKMVELAPYNSIPHLVAPVITDVKAATVALKWAVEEMERRYELFAHAGARDLTRYNTIMSGQEIPGETLPYIVIVIDELADLMMVAPGDVEEAICRIAQKARACGIHLVVATQRPSVDVITGLIKSNIPTRIAFTVSSQVDSRTIIDIGGAEKLLGRGDMLFLGNGTSKPVRVQGVYVSDEEIEKSVAHVKSQMKPNYLFKQDDLLAKTEQHEAEDELFFDACQFVVDQGGASTSSVQRRFRIGYNRAARLIEEMEAQGIISEARGTKPRDVLITEDEFAAMQDTNV